MKLTGKNRSTQVKTCRSIILSTTNPTRTDPGSNPGLRGKRPATNRLSHGTALTGSYGNFWRCLIAIQLHDRKRNILCFGGQSIYTPENSNTLQGAKSSVRNNCVLCPQRYLNPTKTLTELTMEITIFAV